MQNKKKFYVRTTEILILMSIMGFILT